MAKRGRPRKNPESVVSFDPKALDAKQDQREAGGICEFTLTADNAILLEIAKKYMLVLETVQTDDGENMTFDGLMNFLIENALAKLIKKIADQYKMNVNQLKFTLDECPCNGWKMNLQQFMKNTAPNSSRERQLLARSMSFSQS